ncbi:nucleoplasmin-like protein ANO39 isoform X1 [Ostrea edulis]|uniref:nucleoplasmin-like protein ANO39 isoform X1 n=1 Tax=Ostrea edulis TaxID=37623 RepID=UPI0024AEA0B0|nr:nucleoplasmin-like protein ANO39 isoform X1 [Ostrea edulis]
MAEQAREYVWDVSFVACELNKDKPTFVFSFKEEDEDEDYLIHTLFLKNAVLGASAVENERNIVQMETKNSNRKDFKAPILSLTTGKTDMCLLDLSFGEEVTFRLVEGSGPVFLSAQELIEYPEENMGQDEDLEDYTETEEEDLKETDEESPKKEATSKKRKALAAKGKGKAKKKKVETESESEDEEDDDVEEEEMESDGDEEEDEEEEEVSSSPEKKKSSKKDTNAKSGRKVVKKGKSVKKGKK